MVCACMRKRERAQSGQSVARDRTPQPNNIHNIHQICIYYLAGIFIYSANVHVCLKRPSLYGLCADSWVCTNMCMFFGFVCCGACMM